VFPIDAFRNTLAKAVRIFESLSIGFHLTGGVATVAYGEPRMTQDIDVVIDNASTAERLELFLQSLSQSDFMYDEATVRSAVDGKQMFQLLDTRESFKLDIYPRELIPGELERSVLIEVFEGMRLPVASLVDAAASKLVWISKGSYKSRRDLRQIVRSSSESERRALVDLSQELGLGQLLQDVLAEPDEPLA
jgi:hypothetical protein